MPPRICVLGTLLPFGCDLKKRAAPPATTDVSRATFIVLFPHLAGPHVNLIAFALDLMRPPATSVATMRVVATAGTAQADRLCDLLGHKGRYHGELAEPGHLVLVRLHTLRIQDPFPEHLEPPTYAQHRNPPGPAPVSYTHLRAHETDSYLVCRLLLEKKNKPTTPTTQHTH